MRMTDEDLKCKSKLDLVMFRVDRLEETSALCLSCVAAPCFISYQLTILPRTSYQPELLRGMPPLPQIPCTLIAEVSSMAATPSGSLPETCSRFLSLSSGTSHWYWCSPLIKVLGLMIEWCVEDLILYVLFLTFLLTNE